MTEVQTNDGGSDERYKRTTKEGVRTAGYLET